MRKEQLKLRTDGNGAVAPLTSDDSDIENESINKELTSGSGDAFDSLLNSKSDDSSSTTKTTKKTNGVPKVPSPVADDSDTEKNDTETEEAENEADATEANETAIENAAANENDESGENEKEEEQYEVEAIVGTRSRRKETQYHIKWKNYPESENTWEFESNLNCPELIAEYLEKNPQKEKKVRISLPATREAPKRSATENKSLAESDQESDDASVKAKSPKKKPNDAKSPNGRARGRPKKGTTKPAPAEEEYEVEKIVDEMMEGGKKYFRIRWKGYGAKSDTWELKKSLNCPDKIKEFENSKQEEEKEDDDDAEYEVEKIMGEMIEKGKRLFYVKWKNWPESSNSWESEASVDCADLIEKFRESCRSTGGKATKRPAAKAPVQMPKKAKKVANDEEQDPLADEDESDEEQLQWEVKQILDVRKRRGKKEYLIRWKNCDSSQDSWEPEDGIDCPDLLAAFTKKKK